MRVILSDNLDTPQPEKELPRIVGADQAEVHRIACPYEPVGKAYITVDRKLGGFGIDLGRVLKCDFCGRYFKIAARLKLYGAPLGDDNGG